MIGYCSCAFWALAYRTGFRMPRRSGYSGNARSKSAPIESLFVRIDAMLGEAGYIPMSEQIVDASLVAASRQRNTNAEKADIKAGRIPEH